jgi:transcription elongation factor Elf1
MLTRSEWNKDLTEDVILDAVRRRNTSLDNPGFCLICGNEASGVEPDAENYECENCGAEQVFGAEELLMVIT